LGLPRCITYVLEYSFIELFKRAQLRIDIGFSPGSQFRPSARTVVMAQAAGERPAPC
jgi:hypothetical protein